VTKNTAYRVLSGTVGGLASAFGAMFMFDSGAQVAIGRPLEPGARNFVIILSIGLSINGFRIVSQIMKTLQDRPQQAKL
jgi:hypothetical protein